MLSGVSGGDMAVAAEEAAIGEAVYIGGLDVLAAGEAEIAITGVVSEDDQNIGGPWARRAWLLLRRRGRGRCRGRRRGGDDPGFAIPAFRRPASGRTALARTLCDPQGVERMNKSNIGCLGLDTRGPRSHTVACVPRRGRYHLVFAADVVG